MADVPGFQAVCSTAVPMGDFCRQLLIPIIETSFIMQLSIQSAVCTGNARPGTGIMAMSG